MPQGHHGVAITWFDVGRETRDVSKRHETIGHETQEITVFIFWLLPKATPEIQCILWFSKKQLSRFELYSSPPAPYDSFIVNFFFLFFLLCLLLLGEVVFSIHQHVLLNNKHGELFGLFFRKAVL